MRTTTIEPAGLTNEELLTHDKQLVARDRVHLVELLLHLGELDARQAKLADGVSPGMPIVDASSLDAAIREVTREEPGDSKPMSRDRWDLIRVGLGRELCGEDLETIAWHVQKSRSAVSENCRLHARMLAEDAEYARRVARVAERALRVWMPEKSD